MRAFVASEALEMMAAKSIPPLPWIGELWKRLSVFRQIVGGVV